MRYTHAHVERGFKVPGGPFLIPVPGALIALVVLVLSDGPTIYRLFIWLGIGLVVYAVYGYGHSRIGNGERWSEEDTAYFQDGGMVYEEGAKDKEVGPNIETIQEDIRYEMPTPH
ncbi:hypothetical protein FBU31_006354 [Coemansia sp. 'formosensis']|nr:hypothetical protein FBU31_006354 [Coemansia sp. 'formosensis']